MHSATWDALKYPGHLQEKWKFYPASMDFFAGTVVEKNPTTCMDIDLPDREKKGKIRGHVGISGANTEFKRFSKALLFISCWMCPGPSVPQCLHLYNWSSMISILLRQEVLGIFFPFGSATQAPVFENFASGPVINTLVACNVWLSQGHAAVQHQRCNCARVPWGWSLTVTPGHPSPLLLLRARLGVGITACMFMPSVPHRPVLPVLFDTPQVLLLLPWAEPLPGTHSGKRNVTSHAGGFAGKGDGWGSQWTQTVSHRGGCQSAFACSGTDGIIGDGPGSFLNLIPADKWQPGASLWFLRCAACFWTEPDTQEKEPGKL